MAIENPAYCLQAAEDKHSAELFRRAISSLLGAAGGVVTAGDFAVSEHVAANMSVNVAAGQAWVPGTSSSAQGQYYVRNGATVNPAISASDATNPRIEKVILRIKDEAYAGSGNEALLEVVKGTAEAGATLANRKGAGATPASSLVLAYVLVPAKATSIAAANIENVATAIGARLPAFTVRTASFTASVGESALVTGEGVTATLPNASAGAIVGVHADPATGNTTVMTAGAAKIFGDFVSGATSLVLATNQHVILQSDGINWFIIAGEPKRGAVYVATTASSAIPSESRNAFVTVRNLAAKGTGEYKLSALVGGVTVGEITLAQSETIHVQGSLSFYVPAGAEWKVTKIGGETSVSVSTLLL